MACGNTLMRQEINEIPDAVERLLATGGPAVLAAAEAVDAYAPRFMVSVARGSSDHAAQFLKYASELMTGLAVASLGPSVTSIYDKRLRLNGALCIAISQSGQSPDIVETTRMAGDAGALTVALTNAPSSPLGTAAQRTLLLHAGEERSVAATKTFATSAVLALWLLAEFRRDAALLAAIKALPKTLHDALRIDWSAAASAIQSATSLFCLGRGPTNAMACEAALKLKETCEMHAEAYSSAEVLHGPVSILGEGFPVIAFAAQDAAEEGVVEVADALANRGARVWITSSHATRAEALPVVRTDHPLTDPIALIVPFYAMVEAVSRLRGLDPDAPRHLKKVTETR
ncbi:MAG: SIS domain-containing protein, partial [Pseudomonadota bacterium]